MRQNRPQNFRSFYFQYATSLDVRRIWVLDAWLLFKDSTIGGQFCLNIFSLAKLGFSIYSSFSFHLRSPREMEEPQNGDLGAEVPENDDDTIVGPGPAPRRRAKRPLQFEKAYLDSLPSANMYVPCSFSFWIWFQCLGFRV